MLKIILLLIIAFIAVAALAALATFIFMRKRLKNQQELFEQIEAEEIDLSVEFEGKTAEDVSIHRKDVIALPKVAEWDEVIDALVKGKYSRIPVYDGNIDNIIGILHSKDLLNTLLANDAVVEYIKNSDLGICPLLRKPYFVPFNKKLESIYTKMKNGREHMAIVVDEYGGTKGALTIEDLIEEIMGDIYDEYDTQTNAEPNISPLGGNVYSAKGTTPLNEVSDFFKIRLPEEYDTLSGFIIGQLGRIPKDDERPSFEYEGLVFKIFDIHEMRVLHVFVCIIEDA